MVPCFSLEKQGSFLLWSNFSSLFLVLTPKSDTTTKRRRRRRSDLVEAHTGEFLNSPLLWVKTKYFNEKKMMGVKRAKYQKTRNQTKKKYNITTTNKKQKKHKNRKAEYVHDQHSLVPLASPVFIDLHSLPPSHPKF